MLGLAVRVAPQGAAAHTHQPDRRRQLSREIEQMDVFEAVRTVLAVRKYQDRPIPDEIVHRIVEAGRLTGSSRNLQPWQFIVVQDKAALQELGRLVTTGPYIAQAPLAIVVLIEKASEFAVSDGSRA